MVRPGGFLSFFSSSPSGPPFRRKGLHRRLDCSGTTAQQIVFKLFLVQSAAFFLFLCHDDVAAAASPAGHLNYNNYYDSNTGGNGNNNYHVSGNDSNAFYRHYYNNNNNSLHQQHSHLYRINPFLRNRAASFLRTSFDDVSVYRDFTTCSNDVLTLSCPTPDSTVFLLSLYPLPNYNDEDKRACIAPVAAGSSPLPYSTSSPIDLSCQYFKNNVQAIRSRCKTASSCTVDVSDLFDYTSPVQRACTVVATFQCHPSPKMKNLPQYLRFCTNDVMRLTCSEKQDWLVITTAVYDFRPPSGDKTCSTVKRNVYCYAPQTQSVIRNHCERKRTCKLYINETTFGQIYGRSSLQAAQSSSTQLRQLPVATNIDTDATSQCPSADNFALYVYFMCVPKVILSPHPRSSLTSLAPSAITASPGEQYQRQLSSLAIEIGANGNIRQQTTTPNSPYFSSKEDEEAGEKPLLPSQISNNRSVNSTKSVPNSRKASLPTPVVAGANVLTTSSLSSSSSSHQRRPAISTIRSSVQSNLPTSSPPPSPTQIVSSSIIEQPSSVFRLFSDWLFALDYIQRNPYPVVATASLGICVGLLLGAAILLIRLSCRLRAARYHPPRRTVGLQCEMFAGRPAVLVRSTASQTSNAPGARPTSGVMQEPSQQQQQQRSLTTANGHHHSSYQPQQPSMQTMAAMCAQTTVAPPSTGVLNSSLYAGPPAATAVAASRPLLVQQSQQNNSYMSQQQQPLLLQQQTLTSSLGSSSVGSQAGAGNLPGTLPGAGRNYTYTPRLSVRWFQ